MVDQTMRGSVQGLAAANGDAVARTEKFARKFARAYE
jgi:hypothetical protein